MYAPEDKVFSLKMKMGLGAGKQDNRVVNNIHRFSNC